MGPIDQPAYVSFAESLVGLSDPYTPVTEPMYVPIRLSSSHNMKMNFSHMLAPEATDGASRRVLGGSSAVDLEDKANLILADILAPHREEPLLPGSRVIAEGLARNHHVNGLYGVVLSCNIETNRYDVLFYSHAVAGGQELKRMKRANLRLIESPLEHLACNQLYWHPIFWDAASRDCWGEEQQQESDEETGTSYIDYMPLTAANDEDQNSKISRRRQMQRARRRAKRAAAYAAAMSVAFSSKM